jgi:formylglycine-generating enzyme required for sulfatase activity
VKFLRLLPLLAVLAGSVETFAEPSAAPAAPPNPHQLVLKLGDGATMTFVLIPSGRFLMGSDPAFSDGDETPQREVTLAKAFYLGITEVTQAQWTAVLHGNPSHFPGADRPVENVSWNDCQQFLQAASALTKRTLRLPTEAEWEYACRAGTTGRWYFGEHEQPLAQHAWYTVNADGATHPVRSLKANPWGLYDVYGNVWEWCADWYSPHYPAQAETDPTGAARGDARVLRGGAWGDDDTVVRTGYRNSMGPDTRNSGAGLRCLLEIAPPGSSSSKAERP